MQSHLVTIQVGTARRAVRAPSSGATDRPGRLGEASLPEQLRKLSPGPRRYLAQADALMITMIDEKIEVGQTGGRPKTK